MTTTATAERRRVDAEANALVAQAERDARAAKRRISELQDLVRAGTADVGAADVPEQRRTAEHAALLVDAVRRQADAMRAAARHAVYAELVADARAFDDQDDAPIVEAFTAALQACSRLYGLAATRSAALAELGGRVEAATTEADAHGERPLLGDYGINRGDARALSYVTAAGAGRRLQDVPAAAMVGAVFARILDDERAVHRGGAAPWHPELEIGSYVGDAFREFPVLATVQAADRPQETNR